MKPVIGITPSPMHDEKAYVTHERYAIGSTYVLAVLAAGGIPILFPPQAEHAADLVERVDGLLLSGGADLDPARYGDPTIHPETYDVHALRDTFEIELALLAVESDLPTLCICRGIQVLNVALGGTLHQDLADQFPSSVMHRQQGLSVDPAEPAHAVTFAHDMSARLLGYSVGRHGVNSFHHQGVKELGSGLIVLGESEDGLVEAIAVTDQTHIVGVQWHPEMMFQAHPEHLAPFVQLVDAARAARLSATLA